MCPEHIKTHVHFNLTRLPDDAAVRSEISFFGARQSSSNPEAMDIGSLNGQKVVCVAFVDSEDTGQQSVPNVAKMARDRARKASLGKLLTAKDKAKVASGKHARHLKGIPITVGNGGYMEKDCFTLAKTKAKRW